MPGKDQRETSAQHGLDPKPRPTQAESCRPGGGKSLSIAGLNGGGKPREVLGPRQPQVQPHLVAADRRHENRPGTRAGQFVDTVRYRSGHPLAQIRMLAKERTGDAFTIADRTWPETETVKAVEVFAQRPAGKRCGAVLRDRHRSSPARIARAAAYSAARCSMLR